MVYKLKGKLSLNYSNQNTDDILFLNNLKFGVYMNVISLQYLELYLNYDPYERSYLKLYDKCDMTSFCYSELSFSVNNVTVSPAYNVFVSPVYMLWKTLLTLQELYKTKRTAYKDIVDSG